MRKRKIESLKKELIFNGKKYDQKRWEVYIKELHSSSDRTSAISGFAIIDTILIELLKRKLVGNRDIFENLISSLNLASRINLSYLVGIISIEDRNDLMEIKNIRNKFAHYLSYDSFDRDEISLKLEKINIIKELSKKKDTIHRPLDTPKSKYISALSEFLLKFHLKLIAATSIQEFRTKEWKDTTSKKTEEFWV